MQKKRLRKKKANMENLKTNKMNYHVFYAS